MKRIAALAATFLVAGSGTFLAQATDNQNLAPNPGFEQSNSPEGGVPAGWAVFASRNSCMGTTRLAKHTGEQSLKMTAQNISNAYQGVNFVMPVKEDRRYSFTAFALNDKGDPLAGSAHGMLVIEWKSADGKELSRTLSKMWDSGLSRLRWEQFSINSVSPPRGAITAAFGIHLCEGNEGATGSVLVDDVTLTER